MKLFKKLMPVATLASVAVVTTPLVTSCSASLVGTTDLEYTPSAKHKAETIKLSETDKIKTFKEDYFSDTKKFAQDVVYAKSQNYKATKLKLLEYDSNATFNFSANLKSFQIKDTKTVEVTVGEFTRKLQGYVIDYETEYSRSYSITRKNVTIEGVKYNQIKYTAEAHETDITKNAFMYLWSNDTKLTVRCALLDIVSDQWLWEDHECTTSKIDWTYSNGKTVTDIVNAEGNQYYSKESGLIPPKRAWDVFEETQYLITGDEITTNIGSYYLSDITFNWRE